MQHSARPAVCFVKLRSWTLNPPDLAGRCETTELSTAASELLSSQAGGISDGRMELNLVEAGCNSWWRRFVDDDV